MVVILTQDSRKGKFLFWNPQNKSGAGFRNKTVLGNQKTHSVYTNVSQTVFLPQTPDKEYILKKTVFFE